MELAIEHTPIRLRVTATATEGKLFWREVGRGSARPGGYLGRQSSALRGLVRDRHAADSLRGHRIREHLLYRLEPVTRTWRERRLKRTGPICPSCGGSGNSRCERLEAGRPPARRAMGRAINPSALHPGLGPEIRREVLRGEIGHPSALAGTTRSSGNAGIELEGRVKPKFGPDVDPRRGRGQSSEARVCRRTDGGPWLRNRTEAPKGASAGDAASQHPPPFTQGRIHQSTAGIPLIGAADGPALSSRPTTVGGPSPGGRGGSVTARVPAL